MTKQHFAHFASLLKADLDTAARLSPAEAKRTRDAVEYAAYTYANAAEDFNPRFDRERFLKAAGLRDAVVTVAKAERVA